MGKTKNEVNNDYSENLVIIAGNLTLWAKSCMKDGPR